VGILNAGLIAFWNPSMTDEVDVRYVLLDKAGNSELAVLLSLLLPKERERALTYYRLEDQIAFATGRVLVRKMLSGLATQPAAGWNFEYNAFGKTSIVTTAGWPDLRFNISHCDGVAAVAVSIGREIGIDVERIDSRHNYLEIALAELAPAEFELLRNLPKEQQRKSFFALWTLKEAYVKATGRGLTLSLAQFAFSLDPPAISFAADAAEEPDSWFFWQELLSPLHVVAVAAQRRSEENPTCRACRVEFAELADPSRE
jgi:4'-phosphopantetheinyl transferase